MKTILAGELLILECPDSTQPLWKKNEIVPNPVNGNFVVIGVNNSQVSLGPLAIGNFEIELPCSSEQKIVEHVRVQALANPPPQEAPLNPITLSYPLWLWYFILCLILVSVAGAILVRWLRKKAPTTSATAPLTLKEKIELQLKNSKNNLGSSNLKASIIKEHYTALVFLLRESIDTTFKTQTDFYTTREFMGTLQSIGGQRSLNPQKLGQIESFLMRSDQVRFAKYEPTVEEQRLFLSDASEIFEHIKKFLTEDETLEQERKKHKNGLRKS